MKRWVKWACAVFLLADVTIAAWLGMMLWRDHQNALRPDDLAVPANETMTEEQLQSWRTQTLGEADRLVMLKSEPAVDEQGVHIMLSNHESCQYAVSMELIHLETQTVIARTALVDPGWRVETIPLLYPLQTGGHHCLARLSFADPQSGALLGQTGRQVLLTLSD